MSALRGCHEYLLPILLRHAERLPKGARILDVGCGNGSIAGELLSRGYSVVGIDLAPSGIEVARKAFPAGRFEILGANDALLDALQEEPFDLVYSLEVIEHLYDPRSFVRGCHAACRPGAHFLCSTPYHGYWKNLALALADKWDHHTNPLFDGGHIKFFSRNTLGRLLAEGGFSNLTFEGAGRIPYLWKSMVMTATR